MDEFLDGLVAHINHFVVCVGDFLVELNKVKCLTFNTVSFPVYVDEYVWELSVIKL